MTDCISRQAVRELFNTCMARGSKFLYELDKLPSVSQANTGHWIEEDMFDGDVAYRCSKCNELFCIIEGTPQDNEYNFCPNCGADMREVGD